MRRISRALLVSLVVALVAVVPPASADHAPNVYDLFVVDDAVSLPNDYYTYLSISTSSYYLPGHLIKWDTSTGNVAADISIPSAPGSIAMTDNAAYLWVEIPTLGSVVRINLSTNLVDYTVSVSGHTAGETMTKLRAIPGSNTAFVAGTNSKLIYYNGASTSSVSASGGEFALAANGAYAYGNSAPTTLSRFALSGTITLDPGYTSVWAAQAQIERAGSELVTGYGLIVGIGATGFGSTATLFTTATMRPIGISQSGTRVYALSEWNGNTYLDEYDVAARTRRGSYLIDNPTSINTFGNAIIRPADAGESVLVSGTFLVHLSWLSWAEGNRGEYTPLTPARIYDTRDGTGRAGITTPIGPGQTVDVPVTGRGGVPATGVSAVIVNVTATQPTGSGWLTAYPSDVARPDTSVLNFVPGMTVPNHATLKLSADGRISIFNSHGYTHAIVDVLGYYSDESGPVGSRLHSTNPKRVFDTRSWNAPIGQGQVMTYTFAGSPTVPAGATAVVLNLTATQQSIGGNLVAFAAGTTPPNTSNLNFGSNHSVANLVTVPLSAGGAASFRNAWGTTHLIADVVGYYDNDRSTQAGRFIALTPYRGFDSRESTDHIGGLPLAQWEDVTVPSLGWYGAYMGNLTATSPTSEGYAVVYPQPGAFPETSNLNFKAGQTIANAALVRMNPDFNITNAWGSTHLILDVYGAFSY